jgi:CelD/BcsL family acetyltransferase involved in cellulose biosynthesis
MVSFTQGSSVADLVACTLEESPDKAPDLLAARAAELEDCLPFWSLLEQKAPPYQRQAWIQAYAKALRREGFAVKVLMLRAPSGQPLLMMPLTIRQVMGLRIATPVGGKHANLHWPLFNPATLANLSASRVQASLKKGLREALGVDCLLIRNTPLSWQEVPNPLLLGLFQPSPGPAYMLSLDPDLNTTLNQAFSKASRKKLRQKEQRLSGMGDVRHIVAGTFDEVHAILSAFHAQKAERFSKSGLKDPFFEPAIRAFLEDAACKGLEQEHSALELHALTLNGEIIAVMGGAADETCFCGMFMSFDMDPEIARNSPGDLLVYHLIAYQVERGRKLLDFGVGEARYKTSHCDRTCALTDMALPATLPGHIIARLFLTGQSLKGYIKKTPFLWRIAQRVMKA